MSIPATFWYVGASKERGHLVPSATSKRSGVGRWWLNQARTQITRDERDLRTLGVDLAKRIGRKRKFQQSTLTRFVNDGDPTLELIDAICTERPALIPPVLFPKSQDAALKMMQAAFAFRDLDEDLDAEPGAETSTLDIAQARAAAEAKASQEGFRRRAHPKAGTPLLVTSSKRRSHR